MKALRIGKTLSYFVLLILAALISVYAFSYLNFQTTDFLKQKSPALLASYAWRTAFYLHVAFGGLALLIGGFQFSSRIRDRYTFWHRRAGKVYVASVFISAICGFGLAMFAEGALASKAGFALLAIAWGGTNYKAYRAIRNGRILEHRSWMTRNYALTFAAVTLRIWLPLELIAGMRFSDAYAIVAWLCWVPNALIAEFLVYRLKASPATAISQKSSLATSEGLQKETANP
ncbi:MAG TPA: DUF2306 domain-containing protein [Pyrinomonadaceae bacterium]|nr:DUF2306 domain-containing protein [Pyrinomonadaceae bacterium]